MYLPATHRLASFWASSTPCQELALKDLSESLPTSVTSPILYVLEQPVAVDEPVPPPPDPQANATRTAAARAAILPTALISALPVSGCVPRASSSLRVRVSLSPSRSGSRPFTARRDLPGRVLAQVREQRLAVRGQRAVQHHLGEQRLEPADLRPGRQAARAH